MAEQPVIRQLRNTMYDQMVFPVADYAEFPRAVPYVDGKVMPTPYNDKHKPHPIVIVNSQDELDALKGGPSVVLVPLNTMADDTPARLQTEDDIRAALYIQAEQIGAKIDKRWSVDKIEAAIREKAADVV